MSLFEKATRNRWRFNSPAGMLSVEDLWQLPLTTTRQNSASLDNVAVSIDEELEKQGKRSFVETKSSKSQELSEKLDLVKYIIKYRQEENSKAKEAENKKEQANKIKELLEKKKENQLAELSTEELEAKLKELVS